MASTTARLPWSRLQAVGEGAAGAARAPPHSRAAQQLGQSVPKDAMVAWKAGLLLASYQLLHVQPRPAASCAALPVQAPTPPARTTDPTPHTTHQIM